MDYEDARSLASRIKTLDTFKIKKGSIKKIVRVVFEEEGHPSIEYDNGDIETIYDCDANDLFVLGRIGL